MSGDGSPGQASGKAKSSKSVRWTGKDEHRSHSSHNNEDYFSFPGGSANQSAPQSRYTSGIPEEDESSSSSEDSGDENDDETIMHMRAATRANTWFNRLRQQEDGLELDNGDDEEPHGQFHPSNQHTRNFHDDRYDHEDDSNHHEALLDNSNTPTAGSSSDPPLHHQQHTHPDEQHHQQPLRASDYPGINPYAHLMDLGSKVSGGLAPGGVESEYDNDPLDSEYRERRNKLLASVGSYSQPTSPQAAALDPMDTDAIPMHSLAPIPHLTLDSPDASSPKSQPYEIGNLRTPEIRVDDTSDVSSLKSPSLSLHSRSSSHEQDAIHRYTQEEAEMLRSKLQAKQSERVHRMEEIINTRKLRDEKRQARRHRESSFGSDRRSSHESSRSHTSHKTTSSSQKDNDEEASDEEELRRLEEAAKQEAEEQAKLLVMSHLNANKLESTLNNDGYIENNRYLLDAGLLDDDIDLNENHADDKQSGNHEDNGEKNGSTESSTENEKSESISKDSNDSSDSESESEDEQNKQVSMRGDPDYVPPPKKVKEGVLGSLLRLYAGQEEDDKSISSGYTSPAMSRTSTPLPSPGGTPPSADNTFDQYSPSADAGGYFSGRDENSSLHPSSASTTKSKLWKRPGYFRTQSSEDALGRDSRSRPKWYKRPSYSRNNSISELATSGLAAAGSAAAGIGHSVPYPHGGAALLPKFKGKAPVDPVLAEAKSEKKNQDILKAMRDKEARRQQKKAEQMEREKRKAMKKARLAEQARITVHIADVLQRQRFLLRLGRALMLFGAPSHRLEEYLKITARVLEIDGQFLYMPGCMLVSFGDATTHTSETKLLRVTQGLNLNKLHATHLIYKEVVHDLMSLEEASSHIDHLLRSNNLYPWYLVVFFYGIACVCCGMFAYGAYWHDMPIIFLVGGGVGFLQFWCQPRSDLYANVFEVSSTVVVSLIGRAFGSIGKNTSDNSHRVFCFAAITQASLALILPGYIILVGALELQTKNLVAGSVRMFYANIYSLFLSFGMTLGSTIFGWIDKHASTETTCHRKIDPLWKILFVPAATLFMAVVNQAGPRQLPIMVIIGSAGYTVQYFVQSKVKNAAAFTSAIGAFTMGVIGNLYSRVGHGLAFAAMLPGIFVLVPSGIAAQDSFVAGLQVASQIVNGSSSTSAQSQNTTNSISELGNSMTQVAVGIVVGLFAATLVVYPLGFKKKRSGLFTF